MNHVYFVCYTDGRIWGNIEVSLSLPITSFDDIRLVSDLVKRKSGLKELIIISYQRLRKAAK